MEIKVTIKSVYGRRTIYPACEKSAIFAHIAGLKTLTDEMVKDIKALGYEITVVQEAATL